MRWCRCSVHMLAAVGTSFVMTSPSLRREQRLTVRTVGRKYSKMCGVYQRPTQVKKWRTYRIYMYIYIYICVCMDLFGPVLRHFCIEWIAVLCTFGFRWSRFKMFFNFPFVFQLIYRYMNELSVGDIVRSVSVLSAFTYSSRIVGSFKDRVDS